MAVLESVIEQRLIEQLCCDSSQWTYRPDITTEDQLWSNFKYILEQNNKAKLRDTPLSDTEFAKIKNDVSHASFYDAGKWLSGENGRVYVHIQRGNEPVHLTVLNNEHIAGGTSVYEVINQYQAFKTEEDDRDRRFDVTLLINGLPLIHIELKNKDHSYMDGFRQIRKYISEGKFRGLFSNVQMFIVSNAVDTKYFAAAQDTELNRKFITGWLDEKNQPVCDYLDFTKAVLRIPEAHEMVAKYTVLDNDKKKLLILRPYQIHAIEAMRKASKRSQSGFIWHTTGSGKTMTSYKATRNLLMDIPSIDKTVFLIDRKDLDTQTTMDFQSYALNDTVDVDDTEHVGKLIGRLTDNNRQMIVTTRQKMQIMIKKRLKQGTREYEKIWKLRIAFVVDECHRAVTPQTKRELENFFTNSLWYGFTGTPIFEENKYELKGNLAQTTEQLYGSCLHNYTIKEAIHDEAVLGFMVENFGAENMTEDEEEQYYGTEAHMRKVLDVVLNHSAGKFGLQNGKGQTYEALLTVDSISQAQSYYDMLKRVKEYAEGLTISEEIHRALPDFPKVAITYSISENEERSKKDQDKMKEYLKDYNAMFGTSFTIDNISAYNKNLNTRLARKEKKYLSRDQQLDLVIVVDRLLTGFDAPCLSTIFMDRQPMTPQGIIQAFSRTNRLFDKNKQYGQVVTFQKRDTFKTAIDDAIRLYSRGGSGNPVAEDYDAVRESFGISLKALRNLAQTPAEVAALSKKQKTAFVHLFRDLDHDFAHLKAFSSYDGKLLEEYGFSEEEYEDLAAMYKNVMEELKSDQEKTETDDTDPVLDDYELVAHNRLKIDYEYIVELLRGLMELPEDVEEELFKERVRTVREMMDEYAADNPKLSELLLKLLDEIEKDRKRFMGQDISVTIHEMREVAIDEAVKAFAEKWYLDFDVVKYEVMHFRDGELANETRLKESVNYAAYKEACEDAVPKFKFRKMMVEEFRDGLMAEIGALVG